MRFIIVPLLRTAVLAAPTPDGEVFVKDFGAVNARDVDIAPEAVNAPKDFQVVPRADYVIPDHVEIDPVRKYTKEEINALWDPKTHCGDSSAAAKLALGIPSKHDLGNVPRQSSSPVARAQERGLSNKIGIKASFNCPTSFTMISLEQSMEAQCTVVAPNVGDTIVYPT
jgi:hypothetical protein